MNRIPRSAAALLLASATALPAERLSLEECIDLALDSNTQVLQAEQQVLRSEADVASARAQRLPSLSTTLASLGRSRTGPSLRIQENPTGQIDPETGERIFAEERTRIPGIDRSSYSFSAGAGHTLYDGGARRWSHRGAREGLAASELGLRAGRDGVVFQVKQRYYALLKAQELVEVQQEALKLSLKRQEEAEIRLEVGAGTRVDLLRLQVAADNARADLINAEQQVQLSRASLNHVLGRGLAAPLETVPLAGDPALPPETAEAETMAGLVDRAKRSNPGLEQARRNRSSAEMNLKARRAAWHPRVSGNLSYSRNNEVFERVYGDLDQNYRLNAGLNLTYQLFDGGQRSADVARARSAWSRPAWAWSSRSATWPSRWRRPTSSWCAWGASCGSRGARRSWRPRTCASPRSATGSARAGSWRCSTPRWASPRRATTASTRATTWPWPRPTWRGSPASRRPEPGGPRGPAPPTSRRGAQGLRRSCR